MSQLRIQPTPTLNRLTIFHLEWSCDNYLWSLIQPAILFFFFYKAQTLMRISSIGCNNPLSMTCCICEVLPAVMLDMVHAASFWILILGCFNRLWNALRQLWSKTNCVWWSSPVTMLPMARNAGVITGTSLLLNNSTSLGTTPEKDKKYIPS